MYRVVLGKLESRRRGLFLNARGEEELGSWSSCSRRWLAVDALVGGGQAGHGGRPAGGGRLGLGGRAVDGRQRGMEACSGRHGKWSVYYERSQLGEGKGGDTIVDEEQLIQVEKQGCTRCRCSFACQPAYPPTSIAPFFQDSCNQPSLRLLRLLFAPCSPSLSPLLFLPFDLPDHVLE